MAAPTSSTPNKATTPLNDPIQASTFFHPGTTTTANSLAIIQLAKDDSVPVYLRDTPGEHDGYKEGHVLNTRFGSFPHSTLIGIPWGSQVRASVVDTGSRGRKRKRPQGGGGGGVDGEDNGDSSAVATPLGESLDDVAGTVNKAANPAAASGFIHILPPVPERWTSSLPHRTQVVYTPDYSYILHRLRARPGTKIIEAGAGSGSFTHAAARAVYSGGCGGDEGRRGKVFSFEFNVDRYHKIKKEVEEHGLESLVEVNERDVYNDGFSVGHNKGTSPQAEAVFLDLPAPWMALPHLVRRQSPSQGGEETTLASKVPRPPWVSPLNPNKSINLCVFSPCIEQVSRTATELRKAGWVDIETVVVAHRRIQLSRDKVGLTFGPERGIIRDPKNVEEALARLQDIEYRSAQHQAKLWAHTNGKDGDDTMDVDEPVGDTNEKIEHRASLLATMPQETALKPWNQGRLITRTASELKAHTSYLLFAILPCEWTEEDEAAAAREWPVGDEISGVIGSKDKMTRKQERRILLEGSGKKKKARQVEHVPRAVRKDI